MLKDEDIRGLEEVCELSLSFTIFPATAPKSEEEDEDTKRYFYPLIDDLSHLTFVRTSKFSNNYINLDLTISMSYPN